MLPVLSPLIIFIGIGLDIVAFAIHRATGLKLQNMPITMFCLQIWFMGAFIRYSMIGWVDNAGLTSELQGSFSELVLRFRLSGMSLKTSSGKNVNALCSRKTVYISKASLDQLSKEAIDWLIGHELTHQKFFDLLDGDPSITAKRTARVAIVLLCLLGISQRLEFSWVGAIIVLVLIILIFATTTFAAIEGRDFTRDTELACDYVSMVQMGTSVGAVEALEAMKHGGAKNKPHGYPSKEARIQQAMDFEEGKPRATCANAKVEAEVSAILAGLK